MASAVDSAVVVVVVVVVLGWAETADDNDDGQRAKEMMTRICNLVVRSAKIYNRESRKCRCFFVWLGLDSILNSRTGTWPAKILISTESVGE